MCLSIENLENIQFDNGLDLDIAIYHEMAHIYDIYHVLNCKWNNINPFGKQRTYKGYIFSCGWKFWTEFFAYHFTYKSFKGLFEYPTFLQVVKAFECLEEKYLSLMTASNVSEFQKSKNIKKAEEIVDLLHDFSYIVAKFLAGSVWGKKKYYKYSVKMQSKQSYMFVQKLCKKLLKKVTKLMPNTYGKSMVNNMGWLGRCLLDNLYWHFYVAPCKKNGKIMEAFYKKESE